MGGIVGVSASKSAIGKENGFERALSLTRVIGKAFTNGDQSRAHFEFLKLILHRTFIGMTLKFGLLICNKPVEPV